MGTHKILVNGTAFAVTAGTKLINGTIHFIFSKNQQENY